MPTDALHEAESHLFRKVVDAVNTAEPPQPRSVGKTSAHSDGKDFPAEFLAEVIADSGKGFEEWWASNRADIRADFDYLANHGRLSPEAAQWAAEHFQEYAVIKPVITFKGGHADIRYKSEFTNWESEVAYVLLRLSQLNGVSFGVCRKCGDLWFDDRRGKGRKREDFCSDAHRTAYTQAVYRKRFANVARHK